MVSANGEPGGYWEELATREIERTLARLPETLREQAGTVPVTFEGWPSAAIAEETGHDDLLGLFVGTPHGMDHDLEPMPAQILLFLDSIRSYVDDRVDDFRREVRITYLHELGHFLGLDEDALTERGLK
jgi:predicted Zn-dependent protease with MMP-like domain